MLVRYERFVAPAIRRTTSKFSRDLNDIGQPPNTSARELIAGLRTIARRLRARGIRVHLATLTPAEGYPFLNFGTAAGDATRREVNHCVRTTRLAHDVVDFDAAVRDPSDRSLLRPRHSSDHLHPAPPATGAWQPPLSCGACGARAAAELAARAAAPAQAANASLPRHRAGSRNSVDRQRGYS